jgi:23S rRNA (cytidine2498-2'-O)-methyltransferase
MVGQVWQVAEVLAAAGSKTPIDIHVWQREAAVDVDASQIFVTPLCVEIEAALRVAAPEALNIEREVPTLRRAAPRNSRVLDVVVVEPGEWWIGYHQAVRRSERWPGGVIPVRLPEHAVSRAYMKMEEALQWSDLPVAREDECVEIGCAPGGASQALLDRGMFVTGIDPAEVDPAVVKHPRFRHLRKRGSDVRRHEFLGVRWLAADMNIAPGDTLDEVESIVKSPQSSIRGLVLTLKLSDWGVAERLPEFVERVRGWGYRDVRTRQLVTGGTEVCLVALRRKALRRLRGRKSIASKSGRKQQDQAQNTPSDPHF